MRQTFFIALFISLPIAGFSQLSIEEHLGMENIKNPSVSESKIIYVKTSKESWDGKTHSSIILADLDGKNQVNLTAGEYDYNQKWSPDGTICNRTIGI